MAEWHYHENAITQRAKMTQRSPKVVDRYNKNVVKLDEDSEDFAV